MNSSQYIESIEGIEGIETSYSPFCDILSDNIEC